MGAVIRDLQDAFVTFVRERVPADKWKDMTTRGAILREMEDDDIDELKDHFWNELMNEVKWFVVLDEIEKMIPEEPEEDYSQQSDEEEESYSPR